MIDTIANQELYHFGVKGMKWGKRKARYGTEEYYREKAARAEAKIATSKTRLGKNLNNGKAYRNEAKANSIQTRTKNEGIVKTIDNFYGHGAKAANQKAAANYYKRKSEYVKSDRAKTRMESQAYNNESWAKANTKLHNSKNPKEYARNYVNTLANTPLKTTSGRVTTNGRIFVDELLTGGAMGTFQDLQYSREQKNKKKGA